MTDPLADIDAALAEHDFIAAGRKGLHAPYHGPFAAVAHMQSVARDLRRLRDGVLAAQSSLGLIACPDCPGGEVVTAPDDECPRCNGTGATTHEDVLGELHAVRSALAARDERIAALESENASMRAGAMERIRELTARADALAVLVTDGGCDHRYRCTCGSGGHPRECKRHPNAFRHHVAELSAIGSVEAAEGEARLTEAIEEEAMLRERIAKIEAALREACDLAETMFTNWTATDRARIDRHLGNGAEDEAMTEIERLRAIADGTEPT